MSMKMWHTQQVQQTRPGLANGGMYFQSKPNSWEDILDSGSLDRQFNQMNFNGVHQQYQHHQQQQYHPMPTRQPVPLMSVMQPPPPHLLGHLINNGHSNNNGLLGRQPPPPLMSQTVVPPRLRYQQRVPHQQQFQPHPSTLIVHQPQRMNGMSQAIPSRATMIDTSVPPPRLPHFQPPPRPVVLQRPRPPPPVIKGPLTNTDLSPPFSNNTQTVKIVGEDEHRTLYTAPGPKVKILKRPSSTPSNLSSQGGSGDGNLENDVDGSNGNLNSATKSLKQREEEYAQARLRILGSTGAEASSGLTQDTESKSTF